jgi:hypothetical protein
MPTIQHGENAVRDAVSDTHFIGTTRLAAVVSLYPGDQGQPDQLGNRAGLHFGHEVGAV